MFADNSGKFISLLIGGIALLCCTVGLGNAKEGLPPPEDGVRVFHWASDAYLSGVQVRVADTVLETLSDAEGTLRFGDQAGPTQLSRIAAQSEQNAVRAADALAALRMAVGLTPQAGGEPATPFQYWAADVNEDGRVTAADALEILRMAVRAPQARPLQWLFIPDSQAEGVVSAGISRSSVPVPQAIASGQEVVALLRGDVLGTWSPPQDAILRSEASGPGPSTPPPPITVAPPPAPDITFAVAGASSLHALDQPIEELATRARSRDGMRELLTYRTHESGSPRQNQGNLAAASNLLAIDAFGNARTAVRSDLPVRVMYSATDPRGEYVYIALDIRQQFNDPADYRQMIASKDCALYRVRIRDNEHSCVHRGVYVQPIDRDYREVISAQQKPLQFNPSGDLLYAARTFLRSCSGENASNCQISTPPTPARLYRTSVNDDPVALTQDDVSVDFFIALTTGEVVYRAGNMDQFGNTSGNPSLYMRQSNRTLLLSSDMPVDYFTVDTHQSVLFGAWEPPFSIPGIRLARPLPDNQGVDRAFLNPWNNLTPRRLLVADDGKLYGVLENPNTSLEVKQILPYQMDSKVSIPFAQGGWWSRMEQTPFLVGRGFLFYRDMEDVPNMGPRDTIRMVRLETGAEFSALSDAQQRFRITSWQLRANQLTFSALDLNSSTTYIGQIDVIKLRRNQTDYLTLREVASAIGAAAEVRDIESLRPVQPEMDTGMNPGVVVYTDRDNPYSISLNFTKYMNKESVENGLTLRDSEASSNIASFKLWIYQALHLIPDLSDSGLADNSTVPLDLERDYRLTLQDRVEDAWGWLVGGQEVDLRQRWGGREPDPVQPVIPQVAVQTRLGIVTQSGPNSLDASLAGSISPASANGDEGFTPDFSIAPSSGYRVHDVQGCPGTLGMDNIFRTDPILQDCVVAVSFMMNEYTVNAASTMGGRIEGASVRTVLANDTTAFNLLPDLGHELTSVEGCQGEVTVDLPARTPVPYTTGPITEDCAVAVQFAPSRYTLEFDTQSGEEIPSIRAPFGSTVNLPEPVRAEHSFLGWTLTAEGGEQSYQAGDPLTITAQDLQLFAQWIETPDLTISPEITLGTGDIQFRLRWTGGEDLDLHVIDPEGTQIWFANRTSPSGGELDRDVIPSCGFRDTHVENVYWPTNAAPSGLYQAYVHVFRSCPDQSFYLLEVLVDGEVVDKQEGITDFTTSRSIFWEEDFLLPNQ